MNKVDSAVLSKTAENNEYLEKQIITYLGNKRKLLNHIEAVIKDICHVTGKEKFVCADLFSGSGVVARMLKQYSNKLIVNDMEEYSEIINKCYLTNSKDFDVEKYNYYLEMIRSAVQNGLHSGVISENYAPQDMMNIKENERVFYTPRNAQYIDTVRDCIDKIEVEYQKFFMAPLLYEASVHANTSGVFKGFYKDSKTKIGRYGGNGNNCLDRITSDIELKTPIFSNFDSEVEVYREDTNKLVKELKGLDIAYLDPPYNQHPYGSNYFMLNTIIKNKLGDNISPVSGIPNDWNRSDYNKSSRILPTFEDLILNLDSRFIIVSYNSEGFLSREQIENVLKRYGPVKTISINYNAFRGSRNLKDRDLYVNEYLFVLNKGGISL